MHCTCAELEGTSHWLVNGVYGCVQQLSQGIWQERGKKRSVLGP